MSLSIAAGEIDPKKIESGNELEEKEKRKSKVDLDSYL